MKFLIVFGVVVAVASAQFQYNRYNKRPFQYSTPSPTYAPLAPRPTYAPSPARLTNEASAQILRYDNDIQPDGAFLYSYETENGIRAEAQGTPRDFGGNPPLRPDIIQGNYAYTSPEGYPIAISYIADENGYRAEGESIPRSPPIPPQIARALEYIARNPQKK